MKTIFAKYNSERLPKYQIVTKIVLDNNGQKYAIKEALCDEAKVHIEDIYNNYELLKNSHNLNLVKPTKIENGVMFEMAQGISLENILLEAVAYNDKEKFTKYINKFLDLLDTMVIKQNAVFKPSQEFKVIFGEWESNEPQDIIKVANIDLIFGNIFLDEDSNFTLIDYEWVFDFEVPKSYILWRSLAMFSAYHSIDLSKYMNDFDDIENKRFLKHDEVFSNFVHGEYKKYFLAPKVGKNVDFINLDKKENIINYDFFIQLFVSQDTHFTEENSIKYPVSQTTELQRFEFDLKDFENIKNLRLDPLNDSCVVNIEKLYLQLEDDFQIELKSNIQENPYIFYDSGYSFEIGRYSTVIKSLIVEIEYLHIGDIAKKIIIEQKENYIQEQREKIDNQKIIIEQKENYIQEQREKIDNQKIIIEQKENYIQEQREKIDNQKIIIEQKENYIQEQREKIDNQKIIIEQKENYIQEQREKIDKFENTKIFKFLNKIKLIKE